MWISFLSGVLSASFAYALFREKKQQTGRIVIIHCQSCRKQTRHEEVEHNLYECEMCGRELDLRVSYPV